MGWQYTSATEVVRNYKSMVDARLLQLDEGVQAVATMFASIPGIGDAAVSFVASDATLGTGSTLRQVRITNDKGNAYAWDTGISKWHMLKTNIYALETDIPSTVELAAGNTAVIGGVLKVYSGSAWGAVIDTTPRTIVQPRFEVSATGGDYIKMSGGVWEIEGIGIVYNDATIDYQFQNLAASTMLYLYIDVSTISAAGAITDANLTDATTAPTPDLTEGGRLYNGSDLFIMAVLGTGTADYLDFWHVGDKITYDVPQQDVSWSDPGTTWTTYTLSLPDFPHIAGLIHELDYNGGTVVYVKARVRPYGSSSTDGHLVNGIFGTSDVYTNTFEYPIYDQKIDGKLSDGTGQVRYNIYSAAWVLAQ